MPTPPIAIVMGSQSDWETMKEAADILVQLNVPHTVRIVSAHRTPDLLFSFAENASNQGVKVIIAGAGGAAHLPGMIASKTHLPVLGVPVESKALHGMDSLLSIVQMPGGIPVGTFAIGQSGAKNAALFACSILALTSPSIKKALLSFRNKQTQSVLENPDPRKESSHKTTRK
jgi:5-(carboxyamino)imidazole ribonucleotide mutase